MTQRV